jgi:hypothetical protein
MSERAEDLWRVQTPFYSDALILILRGTTDKVKPPSSELHAVRCLARMVASRSVRVSCSVLVMVRLWSEAVQMEIDVLISMNCSSCNQEHLIAP